jgi:2-dehydro-3-deoxyphosphogluconate aldolase/(4S)-4-hydroxy-2-oxoglutarate aldolase
MSFYDKLKEHKLVVIIRGISKKQLIPVTEALHNGGVKLIEITMNTDGAEDMIEQLDKEFSGQVLVGAGTVLDVEMAEKAVSAGAKYLITPNLDSDVIQFGIRNGIDVLPGVMTPTEIIQAYKAGAEMVKVFPSASIGLQYIKELQGPLSHIPMVAVGGVNAANVQEYLKAGVAGVGVGGSLVDKDALRLQDYGKIQDLAYTLVKAIKGR